MKRLLTMILLSMVLLLISCSNKTDQTEVSKKEYQIYYIDSKSSGIVSEDYAPNGQTKEYLVQELLEVLQSDPKNMVYKKAIPDNISIKDYSIIDNQLIINFDSNYSQLEGIPEVLCRATVVKTMCQITGIDFVLFNVNGQALIDSNGVQTGLMTSESFIENTAAETNYKVTLYFANETGDLLKTTTRNIYYTDTAPIEELVINQLINGSTEMGLYSTIPDGTTLLNISTKERICYVDFNEKFLDSIPGIKDEVAIYSVVNSLVELPGINKVQFRINGQIVEYYNNTPFDVLFERNLSINEDNQ
ncbi:MAG: GerMN domain-containing protein [Clostridiales bacterium]|nr:GerMN domain-containing protein [Clostridiales bacterium]